MRNSSLEDWHYLLNLEKLREHCVLYDMGQRSCSPANEHFPWPLIYLAGRFNKKHILALGGTPKRLELNNRLNNFAKSQRWKWVLRKTPARFPSIRYRTAPTYCGEKVAKEINSFLCQLSKQVHSAAKRSCSLARLRNATNCTGLIKFAMALCGKLKITLVPADKGGGWCFMSSEALVDAHLEVLKSSLYEEVNPNTVKENDVHERHGHMINRIIKMEDETELQVLRRSVRDNSLLLNLSITIKTHKPPGEVGFRAICGASKFSLKGAALWVAKQFREVTKQKEYIITTTAQFVEKVKLLKPNKDYSFIKMDVKDFYLSGDFNSITDDIKEEFKGPRGELLVDAIWMLLGAQLITSKFHSDRVWKARKGTGIGLVHSGDLADWLLWSKVEKWLLDLRCIREESSIVGYFRFRDDVLLIGTNLGKMNTFVRR